MMFLLWVIALYLALGMGVYAFSVFSNYMFLGFFSFKITEECIGICKYPKWLLGWVYWIVRRFK